MRDACSGDVALLTLDRGHCLEVRAVENNLAVSAAEKHSILPPFRS